MRTQGTIYWMRAQFPTLGDILGYAQVDVLGIIRMQHVAMWPLTSIKVAACLIFLMPLVVVCIL